MTIVHNHAFDVDPKHCRDYMAKIGLVYQVLGSAAELALRFKTFVHEQYWWKAHRESHTHRMIAS